MTEQEQEPRSAREKMSEGIRQGLGVLSAFKEAIEETIAEARERGDLSQDRAKEVMRSALDRAQSAADEARERLDFVSQREFDRLAEKVEELKVRLENLERRADQQPIVDEPPAGDEDGGEPEMA